MLMTDWQTSGVRLQLRSTEKEEEEGGEGRERKNNNGGTWVMCKKERRKKEFQISGSERTKKLIYIL